VTLHDHEASSPTKAIFLQQWNLQEVDEDCWGADIEEQLLSLEGPLAATFQGSKKKRMEVDTSGLLPLADEEDPFFNSLPTLPEDAVQEGASWSTLERVDPKSEAVEVCYVLKQLVVVEDELQAIIESTFHSGGGEYRLSVSRGCLLFSKIEWRQELTLSATVEQILE